MTASGSRHDSTRGGTGRAGGGAAHLQSLISRCLETIRSFNPVTHSIDTHIEEQFNNLVSVMRKFQHCSCCIRVLIPLLYILYAFLMHFSGKATATRTTSPSSSRWCTGGPGRRQGSTRSLATSTQTTPRRCHVRITYCTP